MRKWRAAGQGLAQIFVMAKKTKAQLLCSVPGIHLILATGHSLIVSF